MSRKIGHCKNNICPKGGIKIHETNECAINKKQYANNEDQIEFFNKIKNQNR